MDSVLVILPDGSVRMYDDPWLRAAQVLLEFPGHELTCCAGICEHPPVPFAAVLSPGATYHLYSADLPLDLRNSTLLSPRDLPRCATTVTTAANSTTASDDPGGHQLLPAAADVGFRPLRRHQRTASFSALNTAHFFGYTQLQMTPPWDMIQAGSEECLQQGLDSGTEDCCHVECEEQPAEITTGPTAMDVRRSLAPQHLRRRSQPPASFPGAEGPGVPISGHSYTATCHSCNSSGRVMSAEEQAMLPRVYPRRASVTEAVEPDWLHPTADSPPPMAYIGMEWLHGTCQEKDRREVSARYDLIDLDQFDFAAHEARHGGWSRSASSGDTEAVPTKQGPSSSKPIKNFLRKAQDFAASKVMRRSRTGERPEGRSRSARHAGL